MESDTELDIDFDIDPESDSGSVPPSSSLSSSSSSFPCFQPRRWKLSTYPTWSLPWPPPPLQQETYPPMPSSLPYFWSNFLHHCSPPNWSQKIVGGVTFPLPISPFFLSPPPLPTSPLLLHLCAFPPSYSPPPAPPYFLRNYRSAPRVAMSLSVPLPV